MGSLRSMATKQWINKNFKEQKSLSARIPQPQLNVLIVSLAYILSLKHYILTFISKIALLISVIMILHYYKK